MTLRWIPWIFVVTFAVSGLLDALYWTPNDPVGPTFIPHAFVIGAMCLLWCKGHAREAGIRLPSGSALICGLLPPIGIPLYLVRSMGWRRGGLSSAKALLTGVLAYGLYEVAFRITARLVYS
jgi:hypothetical protein